MKNFAFEKIKPHLLSFFVLLVVTVTVYATVLGHNFLVNWDDHIYVTQNEAIRGFSFAHVKEAFTRIYVGNYAPLQIISYMFDYTLWGGLSPAGFFFTNILLHFLNGLLFYILAVRITGRPLWGFCAAFIFLFHPVQVETVAWVSQRKNLLSLFFFLGAFLLYNSYRDTENPQKRRWFLYVLSVAFYIFSLLSKSVAVILPLALFLYDHCFYGNSDLKRRVVDKLPYLVAALFVAVVAINSQTAEFDGGRVEYHGGGPLGTFFTMLPVLARYLAILFWPTQLSVMYDPPVKTGFDGEVALAALLALSLVLLGIFLYRRNGKELFFCYLLFFVALLPVAQIIPISTLMNDRYLYFPMLGASLFLVCSVLGALERTSGSAKKIAAAILCLPMLSLPILAHGRAGVWKDAITLWSDAVRKEPNNAGAWVGLGNAYHVGGELVEAEARYYKALALDPTSCDANTFLGQALMQEGDLEKSRVYFLKVVEGRPDFFPAFIWLGNNYYTSRDFEKAEVVYKRALLLKPGSSQVLTYLGNIYLGKRELREARQYYEKAIAAGGSTAELEYDMACLAALEGRPDESMQHLDNSFRKGFKWYKLVLSNHELDPIRKRPDFQKLISSYGGAIEPR